MPNERFFAHFGFSQVASQLLGGAQQCPIFIIMGSERNGARRIVDGAFRRLFMIL